MERNPNHPTTVGLRGHWHKVVAVLLLKTGATSIDITAADMQALAESGLANVVAHPIGLNGDTLRISLVSDAEAVRLAREEGGLPA